MSKAYEFSVFLDDDGSDRVSMECRHQETYGVLRMAIGAWPGPVVTVFGTRDDMDRFTRATAAFNAAMNEEAPTISEAAE